MKGDWASFQEKLDQNHVWPSLYVFKFIVPQASVPEILSLFPMHEATEKKSGNGNYISITYSMMMPSSEAVIQVYKKVGHIEGLIAL